METKHTPGPWITQTHEGGNIEIIPSVDEGDLIATVKVDRPIRCGIKCGPDPEQKRANARLIAAAPDLLDALEKIDANAAESADWIRRIAREALAKAKGGAA